MKNVHEHVAQIDHDPLAHWIAIHRLRLDVMLFFKPILNFRGNRLEMRLGSSGADQKKIGEGGNATQIERKDIFRLFVAGKFRAKDD
jgi:hypothetical protein